MFSSEKELVEKLVDDLSEKYNTNLIVRELRSGNNIADVVYTTDISRNNIIFDEYTNAYYYFNYIGSKRRVKIDQIEIPNKKLSNKFSAFLKELEILGYIKINGNYVETIKKVDKGTKNFVAIEAKLSDWSGGLEQAIRYKKYADEVYLAISSEYVEKVDRDLLKLEGIGLMSVSNSDLKIPIKAKKSKMKELDIQYYIFDRFLQRLKYDEVLWV